MDNNNIHKVTSFPFKDSDLVITAYPQSGLSLLLEVVLQIVSTSEGNVVKESYLVKLGDAELNFDVVSLPEDIPVRIIRTNLPLKLFSNPTTGNNLYNNKGKYIILVRNARDVAVSLYNQRKLNVSNKGESWDEFVSDYFEGKFPYGSWLDFNVDWTKASMFTSPANTLFINYEDLVNKMENQVLNIANLFGNKQIDLDADKWTALVQRCTKLIALGQSSDCMDGSHGAVLSTGIGAWKNYFTVEQVKEIESQVEDLAKNAGVQFRLE